MKRELHDYCLIDSAKENRLSKFERATLTGGEELEKALQMLGRQFDGFSPNGQLEDINFDHIVSAEKFYSTFAKNPDDFFIPAKAKPSVVLKPVHGLADGIITDLEFTSAYRPRNPEFVQEFMSYEENRTVHARWWRHAQLPKATIIAVHGWSMGDQRVNSLAFLPGTFFQLGYDVVLVELPFHGRRAPKKKHGELFPSSNMVRTNEAFGQIISDLRELRIYLETCERNVIGCMAMSLGAYAAALWGSLDPLDFMIPIVPVATLAELAWELITRDPRFESLRSQGLTLELLSSIYHVHCPLSHTAKVPPEKVLLIAGIGDSIVPSRQPKLLWDHWKRPQIYWFGGGHSAQFKKAGAMAAVVEFLKGQPTSQP